jgi:hypothetical protein
MQYTCQSIYFVFIQRFIFILEYVFYDFCSDRVQALSIFEQLWLKLITHH